LRVLGISAGVLSALLGTCWAGLQIRPTPFPPLLPAPTPRTMPVPSDLPAPVARFYRVTYGEQVPVVTSAVLTGRATMRIGEIPFPARFRFTYDAGRSFRAYFELTAFGLPIMKANEHFVAGKARMELPWGIDENQPKIDRSANSRMWAEWATWLPAMLLNDPDVHWRPIDDDTALLVVPFGAEQEHLVVRFDPDTGKLLFVEAMKYKTATATSKTLWINAVWFGDRPWADFHVEQTALNVPVDTSLAANGP
jgi:hypothetical protein